MEKQGCSGCGVAIGSDTFRDLSFHGGTPSPERSGVALTPILLGAGSAGSCTAGQKPRLALASSGTSLIPKRQEIGDPQYAFKGGDTEIVAAVQHKLAVERGEIVETVESDYDEPEDRQTPPKLVYTDLISMCKTLEAACIHVSDANSTLDLVRLLHQFRGTLHREELRNACVRSKLDQYFIRK
ncbi:hypothetical protein EDC04DRAFT_2674936 [Pisolithus marmoratus]|nr:hypothetical protein EDC04DRAFT_2674936 [Pisolithus marmoratus]